MNKSILTLAVLVAMLSFLLVGCGGGDGTLTTSNTNPISPDLTGATGQISMSVDWKTLDKPSKVIYSTVTKISVDVYDSSNTKVGSGEIVRPNSTLTTPIAIKVGTYSVDVKGLKADNTVMSRFKKANVVVTANTTTTVDAKLGVVISGGKVDPNTILVAPNDTLYWTNLDAEARKVVFGSGTVDVPAYDPNSVSQGSKKFDTGGTYTYTVTKTDGTVLDSGTVKVDLPVGNTYTYSSSLSFLKGRTAIDYNTNAVNGFGASNGFDMATDSTGNIYVLDRNNKFIEKYDSAGTFQMSVTPPTVANEARAIGVDNNGNIYLLDSADGNVGFIRKYDSAGTALLSITNPATGAAAASANATRSIAVDPNGSIFIAAVNTVGAANGVYVSICDAGNHASSTWRSSSGFTTTAGVNTPSVGLYGTAGSNQVLFISASNTAGATNQLLAYNVGANSFKSANIKDGATYTVADFTVNQNNIVYTTTSNLVVKATASNIISDTLVINGDAILLNAGNTAGNTNCPSAVAMIGTSYFAVADTQAGSMARIQRYNIDGTRQNAWYLFGGFSASPKVTVMGTDGYLYVSDTTNKRVVKLDTTGKCYGIAGYAADGTMLLNSPQGLAFDTSGNLYVANQGTTTVTKFNTSLTKLLDYTVSSGPQGIGTYGDSLYTACAAGIYKYPLAGGTATNKYEDVTTWLGMTMDSSGNVYAIDATKVYKFNSNLGSVGSPWPLTTYNSTTLAALKGITVDSLGYVYVVSSSGAIYKYTPAGTPLSSTATWTSVPTFTGIWSLAIGSTGNLFVLDAGVTSNTAYSFKVFTPSSN